MEGINNLNLTKIPALEKSVKDLSDALKPFLNTTIPAITRRLDEFEQNIF